MNIDRSEGQRRRQLRGVAGKKTIHFFSFSTNVLLELLSLSFYHYYIMDYFRHTTYGRRNGTRKETEKTRGGGDDNDAQSVGLIRLMDGFIFYYFSMSISCLQRARDHQQAKQINNSYVYFSHMATSEKKPSSTDHARMTYLQRFFFFYHFYDECIIRNLQLPVLVVYVTQTKTNNLPGDIII